MYGAHNPGAVKELIASIQKSEFKNQKCVLIFNALKDKNVPDMLKSILKHLKISRVLVPRLNTVRTSLPNTVKGLVQKWGRNTPAVSYPSVRRLWQDVQNRIKDLSGSWILATGSFYLVGDLTREMES